MADGPVFGFREDRGDGLDLRPVTFGGEQLLDRIYFAVRDPWWRTVTLTATSRRREERSDGFVVEVVARTEGAAALDVRLRYEARGGLLTAEVDAVARADFDYARIGFCLLLSADVSAGRPAVSWLGGLETEFEFPVRIATRDQPDPEARGFHRSFDRLVFSTPSGTRVRLVTPGELFEFEDQRNWTDPSFKAYSASPEPGLRRARAGETFHQMLELAAGGGAVTSKREAGPGTAVGRTAVGGPIGELFPIDFFDGRRSSRSLRPAGGFQELNARRPDVAGHDVLELAVNGAVHAADPESVLETTAMHGPIVRAARGLAPGLPIVLAPLSFLDVPGDWRDREGRYAPEPPRDPDAAPTSRHSRELAAAWVVASVASLLADPPDDARYLSADLPPASPASRAIRRFRAFRGHPVLAVRVPEPLVGVAIRDDANVVLALANPSTDPVYTQLPDGRTVTVPPLGSSWFEWPAAVVAPAGEELPRGQEVAATSESPIH